jgi:hypothetical protein
LSASGFVLAPLIGKPRGIDVGAAGLVVVESGGSSTGSRVDEETGEAGRAGVAGAGNDTGAGVEAEVGEAGRAVVAIGGGSATGAGVDVEPGGASGTAIGGGGSGAGTGVTMTGATVGAGSSKRHCCSPDVVGWRGGSADLCGNGMPIGGNNSSADIAPGRPNIPVPSEPATSRVRMTRRQYHRMGRVSLEEGMRDEG